MVLNGLPKGRGLILLSEMNSASKLALEDYTTTTEKIAEQHYDFMNGFISANLAS